MSIEQKEPKVQTQSSATQRRYRTLAVVKQEAITRVEKPLEDSVFVWPHLLVREFFASAAVMVMVTILSTTIDAPLRDPANPNVTPNPSKAPWYFLGLQELLHYFPPVVAGVLVPGLVVMALIVIPYFNINIEADGIFMKDRRRRFLLCSIVVAVLLVFLIGFEVYVALPATLLIGALLFITALTPPDAPAGFRRWLASKPLSFWIMTWFLIELTVLTAVGTFFRGPGWAWVWPWRS